MLHWFRAQKFLALGGFLAVTLAPLGHAAGAEAAPSARASRRQFVLRTYAMQLGRTTPARPGTVTVGGPWTDWHWPESGYYSDLSVTMTIGRRTTPGAPVFFSNQFASQDGPNGAGTGYFGLQDGSSSGGEKIAIFSIWNATAMRGANCNKFSGEGHGRSCRIAPYEWRPGRAYHLDVSRSGTTSLGTWWKATVTDTVTGVTSTIGELRMPTAWGELQNWTGWTEYFGDTNTLTRCAQLPHSQVDFQYPQADDGSVQISGHDNFVDPGQCEGRITDLSGAVRQVLPF